MSYIGKNRQVALYDSYTREQTDGLIDQGIIDAFTASGLQNLSTSGYQILPGGLIIQWAEVISSAQAQTVSFPIAFPALCNSVVITPRIAIENTAAMAILSSYPTASSFEFHVKDISDALNGYACRYIAVGH